MKQIETLTVARLNSGLLELTKEQAAARSHLLEPVAGRGGVYAIMEPVEFKAGERFGFVGDLPKGWEGNKVEILEDDEPEEKADRPAPTGSGQGATAAAKEGGKTADKRGLDGKGKGNN